MVETELEKLNYRSVHTCFFKFCIFCTEWYPYTYVQTQLLLLLLYTHSVPNWQSSICISLKHTHIYIHTPHTRT